MVMNNLAQCTAIKRQRKACDGSKHALDSKAAAGFVLSSRMMKGSMKKLFGSFACSAAPSAAVQTIQVISALGYADQYSNPDCRWVVFQNNSTANACTWRFHRYVDKGINLPLGPAFRSADARIDCSQPGKLDVQGT